MSRQHPFRYGLTQDFSGEFYRGAAPILARAALRGTGSLTATKSVVEVHARVALVGRASIFAQPYREPTPVDLQLAVFEPSMALATAPVALSQISAGKPLLFLDVAPVEPAVVVVEAAHPRERAAEPRVFVQVLDVGLVSSVIELAQVHADVSEWSVESGELEAI